MGQLIQGKLIAEKIHQITTQKVAALKAQSITPRLAVILVGDDPASATYVRKKMQAAEKLGMNFDLVTLPAHISQTELIQKIIEVQKSSDLSGVIVQLPLPEHLYVPAVLNAIEPRYDVDCLTDSNLGKLVMKTNLLMPPTPGAVIAILEDLQIDVKGKNITIVGTGALVGKPLAIILMNQGATVTTCNSKTTDLPKKCLTADILISAVGKKDLITQNMVKPGAIVIDAGVDYVNRVMFGDVVVNEVLAVASFVTPTPGGVGPITVAKLLHNTALTAEQLKWETL